MLLDACHQCGAPVALHRRDIGRDVTESKGLAHCQKCGADYRTAQRTEATSTNNQGLTTHRAVLNSLIHPQTKPAYDIGFFSVLHQLCKVLGSGSNAGKLYRWIGRQLASPFPSPSPRRATLESRRVMERHALVSLALWLLDDLAIRLAAAWRDKTVRFNHLLKDFDQPPRWFADVCTPFRRPMSSRRSHA